MNMKIRKEDMKEFPAEMQEKIWKKDKLKKVMHDRNVVQSIFDEVTPECCIELQKLDRKLEKKASKLFTEITEDGTEIFEIPDIDWAQFFAVHSEEVI